MYVCMYVCVSHDPVLHEKTPLEVFTLTAGMSASKCNSFIVVANKITAKLLRIARKNWNVNYVLSIGMTVTNTCVSVGVCVWVYVNVCICVCMQVCTYVYVCVLCGGRSSRASEEARGNLRGEVREDLYDSDANFQGTNSK
ncbi:hypothetical protein V3C99_008230 [Haemonchus contortus]|uniref:Na_Ca_ex domain-containing protein n=1 Tax=Haemonchus contortus TaxID=6289 RepID=A0A7I4YP45_HAECO